jgi:hypothetical protein
MRSSGMVRVINRSISIFFYMEHSTIFGASVRPRAAPNAVARHDRPVTSWHGRVATSCPEPATR